MKRVSLFTLCLVSVQLILVGLSVGQVAVGTPAFGSFGGGPFDVINLGNLNAHFTIPIAHKAGRGMPFTQGDLTYDTSVWAPVGSIGSQVWMPVTTTGTVGVYWGWEGLSKSGVSYISYTMTVYLNQQCDQNFPADYFSWWQYSNITYYDQSGAHYFPGTGGEFFVNNNCPPSAQIPNGAVGATTATTTDGSFFTIHLGYYQGSITAYLTTKSGGTIYPPVSSNPPAQQGSYSATDANGNVIAATNGVYTDTLGQTALTILGTAPSDTTLSYPAPGGTATYTVRYKSYTVRTNFGCSPGVMDYNQPNQYLVDKVILPDATYYQFAYEATAGTSSGEVTGRLASVTLPTGGSITYSYPLTSSGYNSINCSDGTAAIAVGSNPSMTRTVSPGGTWTYTRSQNSGGSPWQTTIATPPDPQNSGSASDNTVIDFQQDSATNPATYSFYETQRQTYQGSQTSGTLLLTTTSCYNANVSNCTTTPVSSPITQTDVTLQYPNGGKQSKTETKYNASGLVTDIYQYAYGASPGSLLQHTAITYASLTNLIVDHPSTVQVYDGSAPANLTSQTSYAYDEYAVQAPIGTPTPSHGSVTGSRGNATSVTNYTTSSGGLTSHFHYYDTGNVYQSYDVNGALTTYNYPDLNSTCGNSFPTSVSLPVNSLSTSTTWNCIGGVSLVSTDANGKFTTLTYTDPDFWRPAGFTDAGGNTISYAYAPNPTYPTLFEVASGLYFNNPNSVAGRAQYKDALGRTYVDQVAQSPTSTTADSVSYTYDVMGRLYSKSMPCSVGYTGTCSTPQTTQTYDALNRPLVTTDGGNGTLSYTYNQNDVLLATGPAPAAENLKQKQLEYDALGRLTSVCEVTQGAGYVACNQSHAANGYMTTYAYDSYNGYNRVTVTQNAQTSATQTRTYLHDLVGRLVSETNPESGTTQHIYDSSSGQCAAWGYTTPYPGDLVEQDDANGNASCYLYDGLHRLLATYHFGPNTTPSNHFVYDAASVNGTNMSNAKGRLAEAFTCVAGASNCAGSNLLTDEDFSYSARGEVSDLYESTPHSGGYYHTTASYWANGALNTLGGVPGQTAWTYGVDGEGRPSTAVQGSTNLVSSVTYNQASQPKIISFGVDSDNYSYDPNTGRMTNYTFTVGTTPKSLIGNLTWNANGSLRQLQITDQFNAGGTQTCNYGTASTAGYDDLGRLLSADCGVSTWQQTFSYDVFGNLTKTTGGSFSWNPGYNPATNRYTLSGTSYDSNGNLLNDTFHTHTWDAENHPVKIGSTCGTSSTVCVTYDAFGKIVEKQSGSAYKQILYSPVGKTAVMNGQTLVNTYLSLPGGATLYETPGAKDLWHKDWLGSARLSSTVTGHTIFYDRAFAPFGEQYSSFGSANSGLSFTGDTQDTFIVNGSTPEPYDTPNRELHPIQGRWLSPDPAGLNAVDLTNPQSLNRYAYVSNNPVGEIDPSGLCGLITAGITTTPESPSGQALIALADQLHFNVAFPYAGEGGLSSSLNIADANFGFNQAATDVADQAVQATEDGSFQNGTGFLAIGFSGGAQANLSAFAENGITPDASNTILLDPGLGSSRAGPWFAGAPAGVNIYRGMRGLSLPVNATSLFGGNTTWVPSCGHDPVCLMTHGAMGSSAVANAGACPNPSIFQPGKPPVPIRGGGGGGGGGGGISNPPNPRGGQQWDIFELLHMWGPGIFTE